MLIIEPTGSGDEDNLRYHISTKLAALGPAIMILSILSFVLPAAHAYGTSNWQVGFSGNCDNKTICGGTFGFWGWCEFGASTSATTGTDADCQISSYFFNATSTMSFGPLTTSIRGTQWSIAPGALTPMFGVPEFFITDGTVTVSGPVVFQHTGSGQPVTFTVAQAEAIGIFNPDTFIPVIPGHISSTMCFVPGPPISAPGCSFNMQLTKVPA